MTYEEATDIVYKGLVNKVDTPEEKAYMLAIQAMELQVAKKPKKPKMHMDQLFGDCPNCGETVGDLYGEETYCVWCGQKIMYRAEGKIK